MFAQLYSPLEEKPSQYKLSSFGKKNDFDKQKHTYVTQFYRSVNVNKQNFYLALEIVNTHVLHQHIDFLKITNKTYKVLSKQHYQHKQKIPYLVI